MAAELRKNPDLDVELINGAKGEFTILADGHEVISKGTELPSVEAAVTAVRSASQAAAST